MKKPTPPPTTDARPYADASDTELLQFRAMILDQKRLVDHALRTLGDEMTYRGGEANLQAKPRGRVLR